MFVQIICIVRGDIIDISMWCFPFAETFSVSDGPVGESTGRAILFVASVRQFIADLAGDARVSLSVTEASFGPGSCVDEDPEWPLCARVRPSIQLDL